MSNIRNDESLLRAARTGNFLLVKDAIISRNADANFTNKGGNTALMMAAYSGDTQSVKYLIPLTKDIRAKNNYDASAFDIAVDEKHKGCIKILKEALKIKTDKKLSTEETLKSALVDGILGIAFSKNGGTTSKTGAVISAGGLLAKAIKNNTSVKNKALLKETPKKNNPEKSIQQILRNKKMATPKRRPRP